MPEQLSLLTPAETEAAGGRLAETILAVAPESLCIYLHGDLGAGKTTFARGFLRGCGHTGRVPSPTYTLVEPYDCADYQVIHMDLYRLQDGAELEFLGISDMLGARSLQLIEWPERGAGGLEHTDLEIFLKVIPEGRSCAIHAGSAMGKDIVQHLSAVNT